MKTKIFRYILLAAILFHPCLSSRVFASTSASVPLPTGSIMKLEGAEMLKMNILAAFLDLQSLASEHEPQKTFYGRLIHVRNGTANSRVKKTDIATYMTLMIFLKEITSPKEGLDQRAALNRANVFVALGDLATNPDEKRHFYQEGYYLYTVLSNTADQVRVQQASKINIQKLIRTKKLRKEKKRSLKMPWCLM